MARTAGLNRSICPTCTAQPRSCRPASTICLRVGHVLGQRLFDQAGDAASKARLGHFDVKRGRNRDGDRLDVRRQRIERSIARQLNCSATAAPCIGIGVADGRPAGPRHLRINASMQAAHVAAANHRNGQRIAGQRTEEFDEITVES